jgi:hypothetical protein
MSNTKATVSSMDAATTYSLLTSLIVVLALATSGYFAYQQGYLDPLIEKVGVFVFKAKAVAEAKEMQAKGMKAGEDFVGCKSFRCCRRGEMFGQGDQTADTKHYSSAQGQPASRRGQRRSGIHRESEEGSVKRCPWPSAGWCATMWRFSFLNQPLACARASFFSSS